MTRRSAVFAALAMLTLLGATAAAAFFWKKEDKYAACRSGQIAGGAAQIGGPFTLVNHLGETVTDKDVITKPTLLYFGYSFCPDVCPLDNDRNAQAVTILEERGHDVTPVFISIDPKRDTPEVMKEFVEYMHPKMIGLTGTPEQVKAASQAYRTYFNVRDPEEEFYLIDHSTFTYLVFPGEGFVDFFKREETPEQMADRVACFIDSQ
ncbi:SCO family protein [Actibacterium sp. MT2.3-13A]|uniref:SCO family protein n=1 Tax=Actibacterium sp. MT2.3-13A TaxID=2828332 RepID=UPI001BA768EA|nr:SCO family protein [Actibacterium sp. MT2.3-13A]